MATQFCASVKQRMAQAFIVALVVLCTLMLALSISAPTSSARGENTTSGAPKAHLLPQYSAAFAREQMAIMVNCRGVCYVINPTNGKRQQVGPVDAKAAKAIAQHYAALSPLTGSCSGVHTLWSSHSWTYTGDPFARENAFYGSSDSVHEQMLNFYDSSWVWCAAYDVVTPHCSPNNPLANCEYGSWMAMTTCGTSQPAGYDAGYNYSLMSAGYSYQSNLGYTYGQCYQVGASYVWQEGGDFQVFGYNVNHDYPND